MAGSGRTPHRGEELFAELTADLRGRPGVDEGRMLRSPGLRIDTRFFAFVGNDDRLIVKLPRERVDALVGQGIATPVTVGDRTMKEWVALPYTGDEAWRPFIEEALAYVGGLR
jgi:hypothetical protein